MSARLSALYRFTGRTPPRAGPARLRPPPSNTDAARYVRLLRAMWHMWEGRVLAYARATPGLRTDARAEDELGSVFNSLLEASGLDDFLGQQFKNAERKSKGYISAVTKLPPERVVAGGQQALERFRERNVALIKNVGREQVTQIADILRVGQATGARYEDIATQLQERLSVGMSRAKLIARDQTFKANANAQQSQAEALGITHYTWRTAKDLAVRGRPGGEYEKSKENHWALEGKVFAYADPPLIPGTSERANPGERIQCRCTAEPVIPLLDGPTQQPAAATQPPRRRGIPQEALQGFGEVAAPWEPQRAAEVARAFEGLSPRAVQQVALGKRPTANTIGIRGHERALPPVRVHVELAPDGSVASRVIVDGNHRIAGAKAAGATQINAVVTVEQRGVRGGVKRVGTHKGPISI